MDQTEATQLAALIGKCFANERLLFLSVRHDGHMRPPDWSRIIWIERAWAFETVGGGWNVAIRHNDESNLMDGAMRWDYDLYDSILYAFGLDYFNGGEVMYMWILGAGKHEVSH